MSIAKGSQASATLLEYADKAYAASFCYIRFVCTYAERSMSRIRPFCNFSEIVVHVTCARLSADSKKSVRNTWTSSFSVHPRYHPTSASLFKPTEHLSFVSSWASPKPWWSEFGLSSPLRPSRTDTPLLPHLIHRRLRSNGRNTCSFRYDPLILAIVDKGILALTQG